MLRAMSKVNQRVEGIGELCGRVSKTPCSLSLSSFVTKSERLGKMAPPVY